MIRSWCQFRRTSKHLQIKYRKRELVDVAGNKLFYLTCKHCIGSLHEQNIYRLFTSGTKFTIDLKLSEKGTSEPARKVPDGEGIASLSSRANVLVAETSRVRNKALSSASSSTLDLIDQWHHISKSCSTRSRSCEDMTALERVKELCAVNIEKLLEYHIQHELPRAQNRFNTKSLFSLSSKQLKPNTKPFALAMEAWNECCSPQAGKRTASILEAWGDLYGGDMNYAPTINEFNIVLDAYAKCSSTDYDSYSKDSFPAERSWELYSMLSRLDDPTLLPNIASCSHLVLALSNHAFVMQYAKKTFESQMNSEIAAIRAYSAWKTMIDMISDNKEITDNDLNLAWRAHVKMLAMSSNGMLRREDSDNSGDDLGLNVGSDSEELFIRMLQIHSDNTKNRGVSNYLSQAFSSVMKAWTKEQNVRIERSKNARNHGQEATQVDAIKHAAKSVAALLEFMKEHGLTPTPEHYASTIQAYARCLAVDNDNTTNVVLPQVRKLLSEMEIDHLDTLLNKQWDGQLVDTREKIPASTFRTVIECFYHTKRRGFGHRNENIQAAKVLERMMDLYERDLLWIDRGQKPLTTALNRVFRMIADSRPSSQDVTYATTLFERFRSLEARKGGEDSKIYAPQLSSASYQIYLTLLSRSNCKDSARGIKEVLDMMEVDKVKIDTAHSVTAIKGLVKLGKGEDKLIARDLLFDAIKKYDNLSVVEQNACKFNASALYAAMISPTKSAEALSLLKSLQMQYDDTMDPNMKPDLVLYSTVLNAIAADGKIDQWKDEKALEILGLIEEAYRNGDDTMMPNKFCFTPVIEILARSELPSASVLAEEILERMNELYRRTGIDNVKPDAQVYIAVMKALARSRTPLKAKRAWQLCQEMEMKFFDGDNDFKPSVIALSTVLNACAFTDRQEEYKEVLHIALKAQNALMEKGCYGEPDSFFYDSLIKVFGLLLTGKARQSQREDLISATFDRCCKDGVVNKRILSAIQRFYPKYFKQLPGYEYGKVQMKSLPTQWTCNLHLNQIKFKNSR